jgi:hypothetical protein
MFTGRGLGASTGLAIVGLLALGCPASAQQAAPVVVKVIYRDATVAVQTLQNAPLTAVLEEFCRQTRTDCEGTAAAATIELPPIHALGTWEQVLVQLMEGTNLNYAAMPATAASDARLLITGRALSPEAPQQASAANGAPRSNGRVSSASSDPFNANGAGTTPDASIPQQVTTAEDTAAEVAPTQGPFAVAVASDTAPPDTTAPASPREVILGTATDFMGNPVPQYAGPAYFPFPDGDGHLIPAGNQPINSSPFPDSNGNLIPVSKPPIPNANPFPRELLGHTASSE